MNPDLLKGLSDEIVGKLSKHYSGMSDYSVYGLDILKLLATEIDELDKIPVARSIEEDNEQISAIRNLKDDKKDIVDLIEKFLSEYTPKEILIALQEKLILMFDYDSSSSLNMPTTFNIEDLKLSAIEFFNFIDFENDEDAINSFRCNVLKNFIKEINIGISEL